MIPTNEQGVIALFSRLCDELGYTMVEIGTACPDAIFEKDGQLVRIEFEYKSTNFRAHKHNPDDVDLIVCWQDDWGHKSPLPILNLERYVTLSRKKPEPQSLSQRILDLIRGFAIGLHGIRTAMKNRCPQCGGQMDVTYRHDSTVHFANGESDEHGIIYRRCRTCKYTKTKRTKHYDGIKDHPERSYEYR